jgi:hypothetical protein
VQAQIRILRRAEAALRSSAEELSRLAAALSSTQNQQPPFPGTHFQSKCMLVFAYYPAFVSQYEYLKKAGYFSETGTGLKWHESKQALAEYFGYQEKEVAKHHWRDIENLFGQKDLARSFSKNGSRFKKLSRAYEALLRDLEAAGLREKEAE